MAGDSPFGDAKNRVTESSGCSNTPTANPDRLNSFVDDKGWIQKVECW